MTNYETNLTGTELLKGNLKAKFSFSLSMAGFIASMLNPNIGV